MTRKTLGALVLAASLLVLVYGGFTYTKDAHSVDLGIVELSAKEKETVQLPVWLGIAGVVTGSLLLVSRRR